MSGVVQPLLHLLTPSAPLLRDTLKVAASGGMGDSASDAEIWASLSELRQRYGTLGRALEAARARDQRRNLAARGLI